MDLGHLRTLLEFEHQGSVRAAADALGYSSSGVSAQLAALGRDAGATLLERDGRGARLTPAGRRLAAHARAILAAADAARADLSADAPLAGRVSVAAFASALAVECLATARELRVSHPEVVVELEEREPEEAFALVAAGAVDLAFVYDYELAPRPPWSGVEVEVVCETPMMLAVPADAADTDLVALAERGWIVNSRGPEDGELLRHVAARAGFAPVVRHRCDALDLVMALVAADLGVALIVASAPTHPGARLVDLGGLAGTRRMGVATRPGHAAWPPLALVAERVAALARAAG